eukprot:7011318-Prymnesium_polylepis.1
MTPLSIESTSLHRVAVVPNSSESAGEASSAWLTLPFGEGDQALAATQPIGPRAIRRRKDEPAIANVHR